MIDVPTENFVLRIMVLGEELLTIILALWSFIKRDNGILCMIIFMKGIITNGL